MKVGRSRYFQARSQYGHHGFAEPFAGSTPTTNLYSPLRNMIQNAHSSRAATHAPARARVR